jgi:hypothetical protein
LEDSPTSGSAEEGTPLCFARQTDGGLTAYKVLGRLVEPMCRHKALLCGDPAQIRGAKVECYI